MNRPVILITMGDPCGIGPEITLKALLHDEIYKVCRPLVIGDRGVLERIASLCRIPILLYPVKNPSEGRYTPGTADLLDLGNVPPEELRIGEVQALGGKAAFEYICEASRLAMAGEGQAVTTGPINKEALRAAGIPYVGHTEMFASLTGSYDPLTMFEVHGMRVFFLTRHVSLREACGLITRGRLCDYIVRCTQALHRLGITEGVMAVAGLNPHSGEHGLFGWEEVEAVEPAVKEMAEKGYRVVGPIGADSVFHQALQGRYAAVLSLYHDQGHIATKTLDFERTIAITNGLPYLRTSVDHGTALDIAGKGLASERSTVEAILLAAKYAPNFSIR